MPFTVEYVMTRSSKSVEFPEISGDERDTLSSLREEHNVYSEVIFSSDELVKTSRHTTPTMEDYTAFYTEAQTYWTKSNFIDDCGKLDIHVSMSVVENT